jgi:hypothetical protein
LGNKERERGGGQENGRKGRGRLHFQGEKRGAARVRGKRLVG